MRHCFAMEVHVDKYLVSVLDQPPRIQISVDLWKLADAIIDHMLTNEL